MIAGIGLPGSGKSSVLSALSQQLDSQFDTTWDGETEFWDSIVANRDRYGFFNALAWFRSSRIKNWYNAHESRNQGKVAFVDSAYDLLCSKWLGLEEMEWLLPKSDPYFHVALEMAKVDWIELPTPDIIVGIRLDSITEWQTLVRTRNRKEDQLLKFDGLFKSQEKILDAAKQYCEHVGCRYLEYKQKISSAFDAATSMKPLVVAILNELDS